MDQRNNITVPAGYEALETARKRAYEWLASVDERTVAALATPEQLRAQLTKPLPDEGVDPVVVVDELARDVEGGLHAVCGPRFFGWVMGGALPASLGADWLCSAWDQNAGMFAVAPATAIVEEVAGEWLKDVLRLPAHASFALVTGCQMAHTTGLASARHALLRRRGWDVEADGLSGAPKIRILTSTEVHATVARAARLLGMGSKAIDYLPVDDDGRLPPDALRAKLAESDAPAIVVLQAGDLNLGRFDDFEALVPIAHEAGAWVHVDGAFGLWAAVSDRRRHLLKGIERCDSWATDAHKWLNVPYDCGLAFVADVEAHSNSMSARASYMMKEPGAVREQLDFTPEFSRRARGFSVYAALRELGRKGLEDMIDRASDHCRDIAYGIGALDGAERLTDPEINQALVRFLDPTPGATEADHAKRTDAVIAAINRSGEAFFGGVDWRGKRAMRISVVSWRTREEDVARTVEAVRAAIQSLS
ncbi:MAG TPA: aminotransferase class V-fold PLP-dependent enzyme [Caulobacteraceae bacterium]|jgi:glutamate/tyrosine decarboxylase-like PLP-dependent enzyme|nr:aminotransferase class V-fold PLP-dependent enzyme [Caulobacteraceae bacterium]